MQQARHCKGHGAPKTASIVAALAAALGEQSTLCSRKLRQWPSSLLEDAVGLRLAAGLHYLHLTSTEPRLGELYEGGVKKQEEINRLVADVISDHDENLLSWFDTTPQTNEVGRSASFLLGLAWAHANAEAHNLNFEILEIGSSGGLNLLMPHYRYTFSAEDGNGSWDWGEKESRVHIKPVLRGPLPPRPAPFRITSAKGCDLHPVNLSNTDEALRLQAFVWVDMEWRLKTLKEATRIACEHPPSVVREDAGAWVKASLDQPQEQGICRVLVHSIVWQYLDAGTRHTISEAIAAAAKRATPDRPLAWLSLETNRKTLSHELSVRLWPGDSSSAAKTGHIAEAHAHGAWIKPLVS
jgi:hypothetical protein